MGEVGCIQNRLLGAPVAADEVAIELANHLLVEWGHRLGPCNRPFRQEAAIERYTVQQWEVWDEIRRRGLVADGEIEADELDLEVLRRAGLLERCWRVPHAGSSR